MTCIVAVAKGGKAWIGGDSAGVGPGFSLQQRADEKGFAKKGFLFGFTSSFRMGQLLRYRFEPPRRHPDDDLIEFMSTVFVDEARKCLKEFAFTQIKDAVEAGGTFIVAVEGRIFRIEDDFQVGESLTPYQACGCGEDLALGALYAMHNWDTNTGAIAPRVMVERALAAAQAFSAGVRAPFHVLDSEAAPK